MDPLASACGFSCMPAKCRRLWVPHGFCNTFASHQPLTQERPHAWQLIVSDADGIGQQVPRLW